MDPKTHCPTVSRLAEIQKLVLTKKYEALLDFHFHFTHLFADNFQITPRPTK